MSTPHSNLTVRHSDVTLAPTTRLPVVLVVDTSGSMEGDPIRELATGLELFFREVAADEDARDACEVAIVEVGGEARVVRGFDRASAGAQVSLDAGGVTPMGEGVALAVDLLERRKRAYADKGVAYFQPWLVILTDGKPTDATGDAEARVRELVQARKLTVFPVATGPDADLGRLERLAGGVRASRLRGLAFRELFKWLSASMSLVSRSRPGAGFAPPSPLSWIET